MHLIRLLLLLFVITRSCPVKAQHQELHNKPELWKGKLKQTSDTNNLLHAFKNGSMHGHFRSFSMATNNKDGLTDYMAQAVGGGIKFETAKYKGFQFGVSGFYVFNIGSKNLSKVDSATKASNRYEIALFDITDATNTANIDRLEELFLKYHWRKLHITFGKQLINTVFINLQDGRMRPTEVEGIYADINKGTKFKIEGGYLYRISPRSTIEWYKVAESIGIYSQGINSDGSKGNYKNNLSSMGIGLLEVSGLINKNYSVYLSNAFVENIFNSFLVQANLEYPISEKAKLVFSAQHIRQDAIHDGGNADISRTYFAIGNKPRTFGLKIGIEENKWQVSFNYNRITKHGRYQMPREWGRDPFFTFLPRERNEGLGDVHAYVLKARYIWNKLPLKLQLAGGYYDLPAVNNYGLNKYGMPSYTQFNMDVRYEFSNFLKGLEAQLLYVHKANAGSSVLENKYLINKVEMSNYNLVLNYHF